jgi:hypothetical protein
VDMLWHDHVADQSKPMPSAHLVEDFHESVACPPRPEQRTPTITTERDEVQIASPVKPLKPIPHTVRRSLNEEKPAP